MLALLPFVFPPASLGGFDDALPSGRTPAYLPSLQLPRAGTLERRHRTRISQSLGRSRFPSHNSCLDFGFRPVEALPAKKRDPTGAAVLRQVTQINARWRETQRASASGSPEE